MASVAGLSFLLHACTGERASVPPDVQHEPPSVHLTSEALLEDDLLGTPTDLLVVGDELVVLDASGEPWIHVLSRSNGARRRTLGRRGSGPHEFLEPLNLDAVVDRREVWVYDVRQQRFSGIDLRVPLITPSGGSVHLRSDQAPLSAVWMQDGSILSAGLFTRGRLARFGQDGRVRAMVGRVPAGKGPAAVVQHAFSGTLVARPDRVRFALLVRHADRVELFGSDGRPLRTVTGPSGFSPDYAVRWRAGSRVMASGTDLRFAYIAASATHRSIYGLYSGRSRSELPGGAHYGTFVHEYDWEGKLQRVFKLDAYAIGIAVDPEASTLYVSRLYPTPAILRYPLPPRG